MKLKRYVAGVKLGHPVMNAGGTCKLLEEVKELARSATAAIMVGSITVEPRDVNPGNTYWSGPMFSLNSLGLPNRGAEYYKEMLPVMVATANQAGKPLFVSVAGFSPDEYSYLTDLCLICGADLVELNLACPSVWSGGAQKRIACFDPMLVSRILEDIERRVGVTAKVAVKISPFSDPFALDELAQIIRVTKLVKVVTSVNTFPNSFTYNDKGEQVITPAGGLAGFAGPAMKPIGLGQVRQLRALLPEHIQIIGVGGVTHGIDVKEYLDCGAVAVQVGTAYQNRRETVFNTLLSEYVGIMEAK